MLLSPIKKFDLLVMFPSEIQESIKEGEIYRVIYEGIQLVVKTLWMTKMSGIPVYFCTILDKTKGSAWSLLAIDRLGDPLNKLEKQYYDLFL